MADRREPTASEAMFFFAIVKHTRNKADIDWDAVAQEQGFKNAEVAKVRFGQVKRKLGINTETATTPKKASATSTTSTPSKVRKTPTSRGKGKGKGRGGVKKEEEIGAGAEAGADAGDDINPFSSPIKGEVGGIDLKAEDREDPF
ncbi:uncharacterized protein TRIVIDRAFT_61259 [Trichoderma virens Gv29-8]|uniref:Myb-like DNA-binding domain-containing protein n=1 Tax=Hypocrea virens (strain Gv29-8 / FGSC 10586) TaxID=413071 RepID=G9MM97_HYPVG|nr:uncharacterized protein TRIVIDRAFT_61259 [Trichoderma virens Gv29-8]EHK24466.1 hypothetical protein TRIVIDRAFT_61259 [Trichoderma virens Gv29-8]UKZ54738.1 hypothetical protein TrVGV298_008550 [Trichoderma virens]UKZ80518.1 hypothetical protein TrVFT333_008279 [Trichoderma virens FT-333]